VIPQQNSPKPVRPVHVPCSHHCR